MNRFSIMAAGAKGSGKSSFFNNLVGKQIITDDQQDEINVYMLNLDCEGVVQKITFIDTPGFDSSNNESIQTSILNFIKEQFDLFMAEENKIRRNPLYEDTRVHCLLYFLPSTGYGLKQTDLHFLRSIKHLVNIIPVLSKADGLTPEETERYKKLIRAQFDEHSIPIFNMHPSQSLETGINLNEIVPFSVISGENKVKEINGYSIEVDNPNFNDLSVLREALLSLYLDSLMEVTANELYEQYRTRALEDVVGDKETIL
ncbi:CDC11 [Enterospora canceri]|uniref:CDC11 n=1 Tax=Enterospora canceri TaxID=1081671 RepID=A0A1Y1SA10_9MICR|nr:CDC11 [Enterospora canceri]